MSFMCFQSSIEQFRQLLQGGYRVPGEEVVGVRQRGAHPTGERLVARRAALSGFSQIDAVRAAAQARHLGAQQLGLAAVPAVGQHHDDRAAAHAPAVLAVERGQRLADARAAGPVGDRLDGAAQRDVGVAARAARA